MARATGPAAAGASPFFRRKYLYLLSFLTSVYLVATAVAPVLWLEVPLGLLVLLVVPGYGVGALALGPRPRWSWGLTFGLTVVWSVAINAVQGLVLLLLGAGLPPLVLGSTALVMVGVASVQWSSRPHPEAASTFGGHLREELRMPGYSAGQRRGAYALLAAIAVVFAVIVYLASVVPNAAPALSLGITGANGDSSNLPPKGTTGEELVIWVVIQNNATAQNLSLEITTAYVGTSPTAYSTVPWTMPIQFANATSANESMTLPAGGTAVVKVKFEFSTTGDYLMRFLLSNGGGGTILREAAWTVSIS